MNNRQALSRIKLQLRSVALLAMVLTAVAPPAVIGYFGYDRMRQDLSFRNQIITNETAAFANVQGVTWEYSFHRFPELISVGDPDEQYYARVCKTVDGKEVVIYEAGPVVSGLKISVSREIVVRGKSIGMVGLSRSATDLVYTVAGIGFFSFLLAGMLYVVFNRLPIRLLNQTINDLDMSRISLADEIAKKNAEAKRANHASEVKSNFLAHMSHEMRTPLNAIIGFSELMTYEVYGALNLNYSGYAKDINKSGKHLLQLVNSVLDLSKVEQNMFDLDSHDVALRAVINETVSLIREEAKAKQVFVGILIDNDLPDTIVSDHAKIYQTLINIVANAIKYTPVGGRVTISARPVGDEVEIAVEDTGIGMSNEDIQRAMEPFGQVKNAFTASTSGTGLGLPIASSFVKLLGGTMMISSERGKGTRVRLRYPKNHPSVAADGGAVSLPESASRQGL